MTSRGRPSQWVAFLTAVQFLTRIPVSRALSDPGYEHKQALRASVVYFPLVGLLIGIATSTAYSIGANLWTPWIAALVAIGFEAWLTGAFHEDAFADSADALGGGWTRERILEILKDSRLGTFGVMALVVGVGLRVALMADCSRWSCWFIVPIAAAIGRWSILLMMAKVPPIDDRHTSVRDVGSKTTTSTVLFGLFAPVAWILIIAATWTCLGGLSLVEVSWQLAPCVLAMLLVVIVTWSYGRVVQRKVGGVTGDFLGSNCFLNQLVTLLVLQAVIH
jgi:adenosylcobinamide-GDP ribazoletransferase